MPKHDFHGWLISDSCWNGCHWNQNARVCWGCDRLREKGRHRCPYCGSKKIKTAPRGCTQGDCQCPCHGEKIKPVRKVKPVSLELFNENTSQEKPS